MPTVQIHCCCCHTGYLTSPAPRTREPHALGLLGLHENLISHPGVMVSPDPRTTTRGRSDGFGAVKVVDAGAAITACIDSLQHSGHHGQMGMKGPRLKVSPSTLSLGHTYCVVFLRPHGVQVDGAKSDPGPDLTSDTAGNFVDLTLPLSWPSLLLAMQLRG